MEASGIVYSRQDSLIYEDYAKKFADRKEKTMGELIIATANYLSGKPYIAATLEAPDKEELVVNLRELDCVTFVENCLALSGAVKSRKPSFKIYCDLLAMIRYRDSKPVDYISRLHYTSDWIYENQKKAIFKDITLDVGGSTVNKKINFMSSNSRLYKHLVKTPSDIERIKVIEDTITARNNYHVLPVSMILKNQNKIQDGDIIAFATSTPGLDYSHVGIAYWIGSKLHFIHASSRQKKVVAESKTLYDYCKNSKNCTGITILRVNN